MVAARLHMICGNCGCNNEFEFKIAPEGHDITITNPEFEPAVFITCNNCSTIHDLNHNAIMVDSEESAVEDGQSNFCSRTHPCGYMEGGFCDKACAGYTPPANLTINKKLSK